ncbi:MAG: putative Mg2+ transporter-C (MgtC) family protein [Phormidesmis priestleyi Ana]|uniref:Putative Mg2+ transporter-C (MgtC) family protein n=1 Tax=Phormidesmis priestleyi Ana TaxID=1666911 RepID=A0A0P7ZSY4_9CYAN|nr:MAG: putative Mg2+ transporter-C (MgtC) family protein [Phormidesmis priestleyi Ana]
MTELSGLTPVGIGEVVLRLGCALLGSLVIGLERESKEKAAGLRTNLLVGLGAAMVVIVPIQVGAVQQSVDVLGRSIQGVMTGAGFVGAGTVFRKNRVHGLTSAAAVWVSAALSIAAACGQWQLCLIGAAIAWIVLRILDNVEKFV